MMKTLIDYMLKTKIYVNTTYFVIIPWQV